MSDIQPSNIEEQLKSMQESISSLKDENAILRKATSKARLQKATPQEAIGQTVKVNLYRKDYTEEYKVITSWKSTKDEVFYDSKSEKEDQRVEITLEDEKIVKMKYLDFVKTIHKEAAEVVETKNRKGDISFIVDYNDKEYELGIAFIN